MFVSSYNTYIQTDTSSRVQKQREDKQQGNGSESSFSSKFLNKVEDKSPALFSSSLPIDYTKDSNYFANRFKVQVQEESKQDQELAKTEQSTKAFSNVSISQNATVAYESNSKLFSLLRKPKVSLDQTPHTNSDLPQDIQSIQESNLRNIMVNTYLANDNYYKITA